MGNSSEQSNSQSLMKINSIFESIQGEGRYLGRPALFVRTSGCNRRCPYCDSRYHEVYVDTSVEDIVQKIKASGMNTIIWTGGEPLLQYGLIRTVIQETRTKYHHLETNGDLIHRLEGGNFLTYIAASPKDKEGLSKILQYEKEHITEDIDIKIVTDLEKINMGLLGHADILMPLTTRDELENNKIQRRVWDYCISHNIRFSPRAHIDVWGDQRCR